MSAYFFGSRGVQGEGHNLFACEEGRFMALHFDRGLALPQSLQPGEIDGRLTPLRDRHQGAAHMTMRDGYTVLAWHDYTGDSRPGSNCVFMVQGVHSFGAMLDLLTAHAPAIAARQPSPIYLALGRRP